MKKNDNYNEEVERFAELLRKIADDIEDNPQNIRWGEGYSYSKHQAGSIDIEFEYTGDLSFISQQIKEIYW